MEDSKDQNHKEPLAILSIGSFTQIIMPLDLAYTFMRRAHTFENYTEHWDGTLNKSTPRVCPFVTGVEIKAIAPEVHAMGRMLWKADQMREEEANRQKNDKGRIV
jgi:hypothetical protein